MAKKSKRRTKQAKRRAEKRAVKVEIPAGERLLMRIQREAQARRDKNAHLLRLEDERAWRSEQLRRARGLDDLGLDDPDLDDLDLDDLDLDDPALDDLSLDDLDLDILDLDDWDDE